MTAFEKSVQAATDTLVLQTRQRGMLVTTQLHDQIVERTPFLTGRAKASWNVTNSPVANLSTFRDMSLLPPSQWLSRGQAESVARAKQGFLKPSKIYTISNNLHYIEKLEYGFSRKAPAGMLRISVIDARNKLGVK